MSEELELLTPLSDHLEALRKALIKIVFALAFTTTCSFFFYKPLFSLFTRPLQETNASLALFSPLEGIQTVVTLSLWVGLALASPYILFVILDFVTPALRKREKKALLPLLFLALAFFLSGCFFAYHLTIPLANSFFFSFNTSLGQNVWSASNYLSYSAFLLLGNGIAFELGALLIALVYFGVLDALFLIRHRKRAIVCILILSAILTPPDVITQVMMAVPIMILYEIAIQYAKFKSERE